MKKIVENNKDDIKRLETEKLYKKILKILSWVAGVTLIPLIFLPELNIRYIDEIVRVFYFVGMSTMLIVILLEILANPVKNFLEKLLHE